MFSIRTLARGGASMAAAAGRTTSKTMPRLSTMSTPRASIIKAGTAVLSSRRTFATTAAARDASSVPDVDSELSAKLDTELGFEKEVKQDEAPPSVQEFLSAGNFEVVDVPGKDDVMLKRKFGEEQITVTFSIADLSNYDPAMYDDEKMYDEMDDEITPKTSEESDAPKADASGTPEGEDSNPNAPPCRLHVVIEKPSKSPGALNIEVTAADEGIMIENVYYYQDPKLAHTSSPEAEFQSQEYYPGPSFASLDEDLQILLERFLEERGVDQNLAVFAADYMEWKEQKEYMGWLKNVKKFVDA